MSVFFSELLNPIVDNVIYEFVCYSKTTKKMGSKKAEGLVVNQTKLDRFANKKKIILIVWNECIFLVC